MTDEQLTYEQARDALAEVINQLESGEVPLSKSMELWERGEKLAAVCQKWLDGAMVTIETAKVGKNPPGVVHS